MWKEKLPGSKRGYHCHLTAGELEFLNADTIFAKANEVKMPMNQASPFITAANRLRASFQPGERVEGYAGYVPVPSDRKVDLTAMSEIMNLGGFPVSDIPEY